MNSLDVSLSRGDAKRKCAKQTLEQLHERRKQVVSLHIKAMGVMQIVSLTGLSYPAVRACINLFEAGGWPAIRPAERGRSPGMGRTLSQVQQDSIERTIIDKRPEQLKMNFSLWSRVAVGQLIERKYGIKLHLRSVGKYLTRWGFTPQKPYQRADEQHVKAVQATLEGKYPGLEQRARQEGAEVHWIDETALVNTDARAKSAAPVGKTPKTGGTGADRGQKLSMIATVTNQGKTRWMIIDDALDADKLIEFLAALIQEAEKKVFLILDNLRVHHSKVVTAWVAERQDQIELFYLQIHSPEINPAERRNVDLTQVMDQRVATMFYDFEKAAVTFQNKIRPEASAPWQTRINTNESLPRRQIRNK